MIRDPAAHIIGLALEYRTRNVEFWIKKKEANIKSLENVETQLKTDNADLRILYATSRNRPERCYRA